MSGLGRQMTGITSARSRFRRAVALLSTGAMLVGGAVPAVAQDEDSTESDLRIGVLAVADAIAAMGRTPELAEPLPYTRTSLAQVLRLDDVVTQELIDAMAGTDLQDALEEVPGIVGVQVDSDPDDTVQRLSFAYAQTVDDHELELAYDDGDLRFGPNDGAGTLTVTLATPENGTRFEVEVDTAQPDELLRFALVSDPQLELTVDIDGAVADFGARQGFTEVELTNGTYAIDRTSLLTLRDPNGRGILTLEDLRYSNLVDLYRVERGDPDTIDIAFDVSLPDTVGVTGGEAGADTGTLALVGPVDADEVWPDEAGATRAYGDALAKLTGLTRVDGMTALAEYTGAALVLQDAADVDFPNLGGGLTDVFAPADELLDLLATSAVAEIRCGLTPENPPAGGAAPGDTVYCDAVTAQGLGAVDSATWRVLDGGTLDAAVNTAAVGERPADTVMVTGSDGQPDVAVDLKFADGLAMTARTLPRTVQDVTGRIAELADPAERTGSSSATVDLTADRLAVAVDITAATASTDLPIGDPATLGALVGLTGLRAGTGDGTGTATARVTEASFDVGFGIPLGELADGESRTIELLPADASILEVDTLAIAGDSSVTGLVGRIGFLGVDVDVTSLTLGDADAAPVVALTADEGTTPIALEDLLGDAGTLQAGVVSAASQVAASIAFTATEQAITGTDYVVGDTTAASGSASVVWGATGLPRAEISPAYTALRVFDPVPAVFLTGTAQVTPGTDTVQDALGADVTVDDDAVTIAFDSTVNLFTELRVPADDGVEVARRLVGESVMCQNVTVATATTLTCEGLAPDGTAAFTAGDTVELIVLGDPFALRDGIIDGLATSLNQFQRLDGDNVEDHSIENPAVAGLAVPDQYTSTLPLVDLRPAQLALERDDLADGLAAMVAQAQDDETGATVDAAVSSAQELTSWAATRFGSGALAFDPDTDAVGIALTATRSDESLQAPLRFTDGSQEGVGQVASADNVQVNVTSSSTTLAAVIDVATARITGHDGATSTATASVDSAPTGTLQAGVTELTLQEGGDSSATLGVTVETAWDTQDEKLTTGLRTGLGEVDGALASLDVGGERTIEYTAEPWESSGGEGATQPAPDPMQVKFLAEGLDGLAAALAVGLDGASPKVTGPDGAPVSAPLIGTDLDAGAEVADTLTALTSALRDELSKPAVTETATAVTLEEALLGDGDEAAGAIADAITAAADVSLDGTVTGEIVCTDDASCSTPCPEVEGEEEPEPCLTDSPTGWETVSVSFTLNGTERTGETPFALGLDGVNVRSDQPVATTTSWTLPVTLDLVRGVGPQVTIDTDDALELTVHAEIPTELTDDASAISWTDCPEDTRCLPAILGYLPGMLTAVGADGELGTVVEVALESGSHDLFTLYDGIPATPSFADPSGPPETGLALDFETHASAYGSFDLNGTIIVPWTADGGFGTVEYTDVRLDVGEVIAMLATPFDVVDPYLAPVREVVDVLRAPIPVISDISELAGGGVVSLLSIVESLGGKDQRLDLAIRVVQFVETAVKVVEAIAVYATEEGVLLEDLAAGGALLSIAPEDVTYADSCTQTVRTSTTTPPPAEGGESTTTRTKSTKPCPTKDDKDGAKKQTTDEKRRGDRKNLKNSVATTTKSITGTTPGFTTPFLADPDQIVDVLTGEGEASYFRLDLGSLQAKVAYTQKFGPIMAGPVPITPFIGGSISIEGRLAVGFDSYPQTVAVNSVPAGDIVALVGLLDAFDGGDIIREGFYLDDLNAEGVDVPEVKLVTTIEAGAGVSIVVVTAGLKGGVTLTINVDLNDPNDDGRIRIAEIRTSLANDIGCLFDVSATLEAFIQIFLEFDLFVTKKSFVFDILRLGPYTLFEYNCRTVRPTLVVQDPTDANRLLLTSGVNAAHRNEFTTTPIAEDYKVRQFDSGDVSTFEVSALNRVQRVTVDRSTATVTIYEAAITSSATPQTTFTLSDPDALRFRAEGHSQNDVFAFLLGETFDDNDPPQLVSTPFTVPVSLYGHGGDDILTTGDGDDYVEGGDGNDSIDVGLGDDVVKAGAGDDTVNGGGGSDDIDGGPGDDRLEGGPGADRLVGGAGNDTLVGGPGRDVRALLLSGDGYPTPQEQADLGFDSGDVLVGGPGDDIVDGGDGADVVVGGDADSLVTADLANLFETLEDGRTVNVLTQGTPNTIGTDTVNIVTAVMPTWAELDVLCASGTPIEGAGTGDLVTGGPEDDVVIGSDGPDQLDGGGGDDAICGRAGNDDISGDGGATGTDAGDDIIRGGHGDDRIDAGPGDDVVYGDDADLVRGEADEPVRDGTLGETTNPGSGDDYIVGGDGDDVIAGGAGSDLLRGGAGNDQVHGEAADTVAEGGDAPALEDRLVACNASTRIVAGLVDLNNDLLAGPGGDGIVADDGRLAGLEVDGGEILDLASGEAFTGLMAGDLVVLDGKVDLDRDGVITAGDTGSIGLASMLATTEANPDGDCILGEDGDDDLSGGAGSDHVDGGAGRDLIDGGDGNDLLIGGADTDVILGGPHHDVLVGGDGDDHLVGGQGDDRLRGNEGDDDLIGGSAIAEAPDGQDVLLGGRGEDVLAGENALVVSATIVAALAGDDGSSGGDVVPPVPWRDRTTVPAEVVADTGDPLRYENSAVTCGSGEATRWVTLLPGAEDEVRTPVASPGLEPYYDELYGGFGCDWVFGQEGDDLVRGGQGDDVVEAGPGDDTAYGDADDDVVIGGSSVHVDSSEPTSGQITIDRSGAGAPDGADVIFGDGGPDDLVGDDVIIGDNGTPVFAGVGPVAALLSWFGVAATPAPVRVALADVPAAGEQPADTTVFGDDVVHAGGGDDVVFGQSGDDQLHGDDGDDHIEGNAGDDQIWGGDGDDDLIGGSSATDGRPMGEDGRRLVEDLGRTGADAPGQLADASAAGLVDGSDTIRGGDGEDVLLGDNGRITRPGGTLVSTTSVQPVRHVAMADTTPGVTSASDTLYGDAGDDVLYGQLDDGDDELGSGDRLFGGAGVDTLIGDLAVVVLTPAEQVGEEATLTLRKEIISEDVYVAGTLVPVTHVPPAWALVGGSDVAHGGDGDDVIRLGAGDDLANGGAGDDAIFGGAGDDALWGGPGRDRLFGGYGADDLDLKPRSGDPSIYAEVAGIEDTDGLAATTNGADLIYGGWGPDELQADQGAGGPQPFSDHLVDWVGVHNVYYVCEGAYGAGRVIRQSSPTLMSLLTELVLASGGTDVEVEGSGAWYDFGLVRNSDKNANTARSPEAPGNFTCEE